MSEFKTDDRVRVAAHAQNRSGQVGEVCGVGTTNIRVRFDDGIEHVYRSDLLTLVTSAVPADERAALVAAREEAEGKALRAIADRDLAGKALTLAVRALYAYDLAHRPQSFAEKVAGLGIGAVLQHTGPERVLWIKVKPGEWQISSVSNTRRLEDWFSREEAWRILSEGVPATSGEGK